jgi:hypothetical protein
MRDKMADDKDNEDSKIIPMKPVKRSAPLGTMADRMDFGRQNSTPYYEEKAEKLAIRIQQAVIEDYPKHNNPPPEKQTELEQSQKALVQDQINKKLLDLDSKITKLKNPSIPAKDKKGLIDSIGSTAYEINDLAKQYNIKLLPESESRVREAIATADAAKSVAIASMGAKALSAADEMRLNPQMQNPLMQALAPEQQQAEDKKEEKQPSLMTPKQIKQMERKAHNKAVKQEFIEAAIPKVAKRYSHGLIEDFVKLHGREPTAAEEAEIMNKMMRDATRMGTTPDGVEVHKDIGDSAYGNAVQDQAQADREKKQRDEAPEKHEKHHAKKLADIDAKYNAKINNKDATPEEKAKAVAEKEAAIKAEQDNKAAEDAKRAKRAADKAEMEKNKDTTQDRIESQISKKEDDMGLGSLYGEIEPTIEDTKQSEKSTGSKLPEQPTAKNKEVAPEEKDSRSTKEDDKGLSSMFGEIEPIKEGNKPIEKSNNAAKEDDKGLSSMFKEVTDWPPQDKAMLKKASKGMQGVQEESNKDKSFTSITTPTSFAAKEQKKKDEGKEIS